MMIALPCLCLITQLLGCLLLEANAFVIGNSIRSDRDGSNTRLFATAASGPSTTTSSRNSRPRDLDQLKLICSDVDGALIHYPKSSDNATGGNKKKDNDSNTILALPPSATGMKGIISSQTLQQCRDLRQEGVKLVLVSGMRTSTLLNRLPYLPRADAYATEAGGRIFYPTTTADDPDHSWTPLEFTGALPDDLVPFGLVEDETWRERISNAAGKDGYAGNEVSSDRLCDEEDDDAECLIDYDNPYGFPKQQDIIPIQQRKGALWDFARQLQDDFEMVLDTKSYSTCFRVNRKHQLQNDDGQDTFQALLQGDIPLPPQLAISTNLGCIDVYPVSSGKRNCCQYLADSLNLKLARESVCICDDDNDIEMALACAHAYIPALTSESVVQCIHDNPHKLTQTFQQGLVEETLATEAALQMIQESL
ncbi:expressed unknown protein [Seminavis robusta]|uniref:Uncharacterized protein n=1 Tax=Seminavis robusta TaxID=568900 RepID=A0A9N8DI45_9STRA|nr:expressed unknown protein [Seminavis robusta]|eukprot:Sro133_g063050.1 n/a (422) ;mRNA; f:61996-63393